MNEQVTYNGKTSEVVIRQRRGNKLRTPFAAIGPLTNIKFKRRIKVEDVFDLLDRVSKGAFSVFVELKYNRCLETNISKVDSVKLNKTQKESLSRRLTELKSVGLIRSVKGKFTDRNTQRTYSYPRGQFVINPEMIRCTDHDEAEYLWVNALKRRTN